MLSKSTELHADTAKLAEHWRVFDRLRGANLNDFIVDVHKRLKAGERPAFTAELASVRYVKRASAGVDTLLHCLAVAEVTRRFPHRERIEALSLGAGTGDGSLDVKTDRRVVEAMLSSFSPSGTRDSVRKQRIGRCCYKLACDESSRRRELWVMSQRDRELALRYMHGRARFRCNPRLSQDEKAEAEARGWEQIRQLCLAVAINVLSVEEMLGLTP